MPKFKITDNTTGKSFIVTGDSPPTEAEASQIFGSLAPQPGAFDALLNNPVMRGIHDAVISPALSLANQGARAVDSVTTLGGLAPNSVTSPLLQGLARGADTARTAVDTRFADAASRGQNTPGYAPARAQADAGAAATGTGGFLDQMFAPVAPAATGILSYAGQAGSNLADTLAGRPIKTTAADAANAASDATSASLEAYQQQHPALSTVAALAPAAATLGQTAAPSLGRLATIFSGKTARTIGSLKAATAAMRAESTAAYRVVNQSGMRIAPTALNNLLNDVYAKHVNGAPVIKPTMNSTLYPKSASVLGELQTAAQTGQPLSMTDLAELRQSAGDAAADYSASSADRMRAHVIKNQIDGFVSNLTPAQMHIQNTPVPGQNVGQLIAGVTPKPDGTAIAALSRARQLWAKQAQASELLRIIDKAKNDAGPNFAQAGFEQALRRRFKNLANNDSAWAALSPDMKKSVLAVNNGTPIDTVLRKVGAWAPQGKLMQGVEGTALASALYSGDPLAIAGAIAVPAAGQIARSVGTARTVGRAMDTVDLALARSRNTPTIPRAAPAPLPTLPPGLFGSGYLLMNQRQPQPAQ